jgi:CheY-like chemotaxis protein
MLKELGCRVITSNSASEALGVLESEPGFTTLLTDVQMPGMDGVELAARARDLRQDLRVVFASGRAATDGERFIRKPFSHDALSRVLLS